MNSFFLVMPKQQSNPIRLKEFKTRYIQQCLDDLSDLDVSLSSRLIQELLRELNALIMPCGFRLAILERIRTKVHQFEENLLGGLLKTGFPIDEKEKKLFNTLAAIQKSYALAYWIVLKELIHRKTGRIKTKDIRLTIDRCIEALGRIATSHYVMHNPVPAWVWIDLHTLYKLSLKKSHIVTHLMARLKRRTTILSPEDRYKQILLMSLADPSGLMQKETPLVFKFAGVVAPLIRLNTTPVIGQAKQCLVKTDDDEPPFFQMDGSGAVADKSTLYVDFTNLYELLAYLEMGTDSFTEELSQLLTEIVSQVPKVTPVLLGYLLQRWSGDELQGSALFADRLDREIDIGLFSIQDLKYAAERDKAMESGVTDICSHWQSAKVPVLAQTISDRLLSSEFKDTGVLSVGCLVSFKKQFEPEGHHALGIVNKINAVSSNGRISFAILLLAKHYCIVFCKRRDATDKEISQRGAFYSQVFLREEKNYLITDYPFEENDRVKLSIERSRRRDKFPVILENRRNIGSGYWHFECYRGVEETSKDMPEQTLLIAADNDAA